MRIVLSAHRADAPKPAPIELDMEFAAEGGEGPTPYEVLLHAAMVGQSTRFTRQDSVEEEWRVMQPLIDAPPTVHSVRARVVGAGSRRRARRRARRLARPVDPMIVRERGSEMKVIIVGGVAGGASCAARLRRLDEEAEILMVERGPYVSYANCGLPYHVGSVIEHESDLLVASPQVFRRHFNVDCRTGCEAIGISPQDKTVQLRDVATGEVTTESYDKLVLSPGAPSVRPPLPGIDLPGIFAVRTVPDAREIREWIERGTSFLAGMEKYSGFQTVRPPMRAVVVGGGFIGLEMAENLVHRGFDVTVIEMADQVLGPLDREYGRLVADFLGLHGVQVVVGDGVAGFAQAEDESLVVSTQSGKSYPADLVILALGVRPDTTLAKHGRDRDRRSRRASASTSTCARATPTSSPSATPSRSRTS